VLDNLGGFALAQILEAGSVVSGCCVVQPTSDLMWCDAAKCMAAAVHKGWSDATGATRHALQGWLDAKGAIWHALH